ncbi:MerR family transcriptional regulator [Pararhizobium antarcticum]|uniref:Transcriptional regulator n=1 Tax=Pararhizobium antarcticum TaxID=1798805 RepID=A0A657LN46_9HYPH|nr:MerR family transcriptional regulator [Pararhizobium antarcticum]OJF92699.1 transcriptional regulator [Pararhizobium antarcticum]OJF98530.1 transcriptional regulator [Rhizobium sp. 58]
MKFTANKETSLTAAQCAKRIGLTVRALRLYEQAGLVRPGRTGKNWRVYGTSEVARLNEIIALKRLGLSLQHIAQLLGGQATDLDRMLSMQNLALKEKLQRIQYSLSIVENLRTKIAAGDLLSVDELLTLARDTNMDNTSSEAIAWRRYEQARPRKEKKIDPALYAEYEGYYALDQLAYIITNRDGRLFSHLPGQPELEIFPEDVDHFFYKAVQAQLTFNRNVDGEIVGLVLHQHGYEHDAPRVEDDRGMALEDALADRIRQKRPVENGQALLRLVIEDLLGEPDYKLLTPPLANLAWEQSESAGPFFKSLGALKDLAFEKVTKEGWDLYDVSFENGRLYWSFVLDDAGSFSGLYYRSHHETD